jgi:hypothetical protein
MDFIIENRSNTMVMIKLSGDSLDKWKWFKGHDNSLMYSAWGFTSYAT